MDDVSIRDEMSGVEPLTPEDHRLRAAQARVLAAEYRLLAFEPGQHVKIYLETAALYDRAAALHEEAAAWRERADRRGKR
jgi:hypothetical protein